jgi:hypothetical protein
LRFTEFLEHSIATYLALVAVVTNDTHSRTVLGRRQFCLSWFEQQPKTA